MKPKQPIESVIITLRGQKVILDADLAELYGVSAKRLNEQVKRNADRFPEDFTFQLTGREWAVLRSQIVTTSSEVAQNQQDVPMWSQFATTSSEAAVNQVDRKHRSQFVTGQQRRRRPQFKPYAFTEHGAIMAATVLNSPEAVAMSLYVVRAFVQMREKVAAEPALKGAPDSVRLSSYGYCNRTICGSIGAPSVLSTLHLFSTCKSRSGDPQYPERRHYSRDSCNSSLRRSGRRGAGHN